MKQHLLDFWKQNKIITSKKLLDAFKKIPREDFILPEYSHQVYADIPLPILSGQTISQPTTVMIMTQALDVKKGNKVLEVGAGSGYQAAILSELVGEKGKIYTTEIVPELVKYAKKNLKNYKNVKVIKSDGSLGYKKGTPYDAIIITAASPKIPPPLIEQLKDGGRLVAPVGPTYHQTMLKITKKGNKLLKEDLGPFMFVPLKGKYGF